jgi:tetratricopeptide (TPR) repeat protein
MPIDLVRKILDRATGLQEQLMQSGETALDLRLSQAIALLEVIRTLQTQGDAQAALAAAKRYRDVSDEILAADPGNRNSELRVSDSYAMLANVLSDLGQLQEAVELLRKSLAICTALSAEFPNDSDFKRRVAIRHQELGDVLYQSGEREDALDAFRRGTAIFEEMAIAAPDVQERQRDVAISLTRLGHVLEQSGLGRQGRSRHIREALRSPNT